MSVTILPACCVSAVGSLPLYPDTVFVTMPSGFSNFVVSKSSGLLSVTSFITFAHMERALDLPALDNVLIGSL
ncbi:hypothetical protein D3C77_495050 [compost metagenome]